MSISQRLTEVFRSATEIPFDDSSKFVLFSDCHRGVNDWADDFANNQGLFFHSLEHYYFEKEFTYIELGDVDELWENRAFADVRRAHSHVFWLMRKFYLDNRLYMIWGNHDIERQSPKTVKDTLYQYRDERTGEVKPLFKGIEVHEGLVLRDSATGGKIFLVHGHQGDPLNDGWWRVGRFSVRYLWRHLQLLGIRDPTRPAKNFKKRGEVEKEIGAWVQANQQMTICGHTHRSVFPREGDPPYFNTGSCVHPRCITGLEIQNREITLIKWWYKPRGDGAMCVTREVMDGPRKLDTSLLRA